MNDSRFLTLLAEAKLPLIGDGAMGTMLNARGISFEECFDALNLTNPALPAEIHREYIEAGSQMIQTNTFGANRYKLAEHGLENQVEAINRAGVELAKRVVLASYREVLVAGDVGPLGVRLAPFGRVQPDQACSAFSEQISALAEAGADLIIIETMTDVYEAREAVRAARQVCNLPVIASMTFTRDDRTLLGDTPAKVSRSLYESGADVIGVNCSGGPAQIFRILKQMREALPTEAERTPYFAVMPNAGWPEHAGGRIMYPANPDYFGDYAQSFCKAGASLIGGCCGTTPRHIAAMRASLLTLPDGCLTEPAIAVSAEMDEKNGITTESTRLAEQLASGKFVVSVEMDPPRGLSAHKLLAGASLLVDAGADVINVADSPMARMRMSPWAVCNLIQSQMGIDTTLHFPTRGRNLLRVQGDLLAAHALKIRNVFVVMGDPTAIGDYPEAMDNYDLVPSGLIKLIKQGFNTGVDHAGADIGQPTSFYVGCALNLCPPNPEREIKNLRRKLEAGADFILTQPVFEPEVAHAFLQRYADQFGPLDKPVLAGILPLYGKRHASFLHNEVPGISIPETFQERLHRAGDQSPAEGVRIAAELIEQMREWARGVYIMPAFGRYDLTAEVIDTIRD